MRTILKVAAFLVVFLLISVSFPDAAQAQEGYYLGGSFTLEKQEGELGGSFTFGRQDHVYGALYTREYIETVNWGDNLGHAGLMPILYFGLEDIWTGLKVGLHGKIEANVNDMDDFELGAGLEALKTFGPVGVLLGIDYHNINDEIGENPPDYFEFQGGLLVSF